MRSFITRISSILNAIFVPKNFLDYPYYVGIHLKFWQSIKMTQPPIKLDVQFTNFAKYTIKTNRDPPLEKKEKDGKTITLRQIDFWFEQAKLFNNNFTRTDTGLAYILFQAGCIEYTEFLIFLDNLAETKQVPLDDIKEKLMTCGLPGVEPKKPKAVVEAPKEQ